MAARRSSFFTLRAGLDFNINDYEDAVSAACAVAAKSEFVITRDLKDFANAPIAALTPNDFIARHLLPSQ